MLTHHSFIFSFKNWLKFSVGIRRTLGSTKVWSLFVAVVVFMAAEVASRWLLKPYDDLWAYWLPDSGALFQAVQQELAQGRSPELIIVGDSTAQSNFVPDSLYSLCRHEDGIWNLACPGGFARAFPYVTMPVLKQQTCRPRMVVASFLPSSFANVPGAIQLENRILESPYGRRQQGKFHVGTYLHLARWWPALRVWKAERAGVLEEIVAARGFKPRMRVVDLTTEPPPQALPPTLDRDRLKSLDELAAWATQRDVLLLIVIPPSLDRTPARQALEQEYENYLRSLQVRFGTVYVDARRQSWPQNLFADTNHLNLHGAQQLTPLIAGQAREVLAGKPSTDDGRSAGKETARPISPGSLLPAVLNSGVLRTK